MRLAIIAYFHGNGGAEKQLTMLANAMTHRGHSVHIIILAENNIRYELEPSITIHDCSTESHPRFSIYERYVALFRKYLEIKPDVTIHYNFQSAYLTVAMPHKIYNKAIYAERGDPYDKEYRGVLGLIRSITVNHIDGFVFQSEGARDYFQQKVRRKSIIIHNSVDPLLSCFQPSPCRDNRIVSVGRLHEQKNYALLIDSFSLISSLYPSFVLEIYGEGPLQSQLQDKIESLSMTDRIFLRPPRKDIYRAIIDAKLFVLSSDYEGMPNALMEAMALGIPCISTDCRPGGARSIIQSGENGFIVPCNDPRALADCMKYLLDNPDIAESVAQEGRRIIDTHTENYTFNKWESFISSVCTQM